jgi:hypothetical protein
MTERELEDAGRKGDHPQVDPAVSRRQRWRGPEGRVKCLLLILFVELQFVDILSTNHALARPGVWEANPLMALSQARLGAAWWLPKLAAIALVAATAPWSRRQWPIAAMVSVSCIAVLINVAHL